MMNIQQFKRISFGTSFNDMWKLFRFILLDNNFSVSVLGYETFISTCYEVFKVLNSEDTNLVEIYSVHLGLLCYHGYIPDLLREEIISNKSNNMLFGIMHTILFFQYCRAISLQIDYYYWQKFLLKLVDESLLFEHYSPKDIYSQKAKTRLKKEHIVQSISDILEIDPSQISISRKHIFKFLKRRKCVLGLFSLGMHTIGRHYYTTKCIFIQLSLSSAEYNRFVKRLDKVISTLSIKAPEFKIIFLANIKDNAKLGFVVSKAKLGLDTWIFNKKNIKMQLQNYIL